MKYVRWLFVVLLFLFWCLLLENRPCGAQSIPNRNPFVAVYRETKATTRAMVRDPEFAVVSGAYLASAVADGITTRQVEHRCPQCVELGPLGHGQHGSGISAAEYIGIAFTGLVLDHALKSHIHNRWLRRVWLVAPMVGIELHTRAAITNAHYRGGV